MDSRCEQCRKEDLHPYYCEQWCRKVQYDADTMVAEIEKQEFYIHPFTGEKIY